MSSGVGDRIKGFGAKVTRFGFVLDAESIPAVYVCETNDCHSMVYFVGMAVRQEGHVTCMRCLRPMVLADCTVH